eukprot:6203995-Pleurochrysis_carterae.AAC.1
MSLSSPVRAQVSEAVKAARAREDALASALSAHEPDAVPTNLLVQARNQRSEPEYLAREHGLRPCAAWRDAVMPTRPYTHPPVPLPTLALPSCLYDTNPFVYLLTLIPTCLAIQPSTHLSYPQTYPPARFCENAFGHCLPCSPPSVAAGADASSDDCRVPQPRLHARGFPYKLRRGACSGRRRLAEQTAHGNKEQFCSSSVAPRNLAGSNVLKLEGYVERACPMRRRLGFVIEQDIARPTLAVTCLVVKSSSLE